MTTDMIVGIAIGAAGMGLLIAVLYLWMPRKPERHIVGPCLMPGGICLMHRNDRYVQDLSEVGPTYRELRPVITVKIDGTGKPHMTPDQIAAMHEEIYRRTGVR